MIFKLLIFKELLFDFSVLSIDFLFLVLIEIEDVLLKIFDSDFLIVVLFLFFDLFVLKQDIDIKGRKLALVNFLIIVNIFLVFIIFYFFINIKYL